LPFVFHGGESLKYRDNNNLIDIILLGTKRIGHGLNLSKHSYLLDLVREKDICIESCPISNQGLGYYNDLRAHPIRTFINLGIPVSISNDDPSFFGLEGVSFDYYALAVN